MSTRKLTTTELESLFYPMIEDVRAKLKDLSSGDAELLFALRRKLAKELNYDERGKTSVRNKLKNLKRKQQNGLCSSCSKQLPEKYAVLDRLETMAGYTEQNTRLICVPCDTKTQIERKYR